VVVALLVGAFAFIGLPGASGASVGHQATSTCNSYPPGPGASLGVSTTTPFAGEQITVSGANFNASKPVTVNMNTQTVELGTTTTNAAGSFSLKVTIPSDATGSHSISVSGPAVPTECPPGSIAITIASSSSPKPPLSFTGVEIGALIAVALLLLAGGVLFATAGRRRQHASGRH
jgi:hypothetical protein